MENGVFDVEVIEGLQLLLITRSKISPQRMKGLGRLKERSLEKRAY